MIDSGCLVVSGSLACTLRDECVHDTVAVAMLDGARRFGEDVQEMSHQLVQALETALGSRQEPAKINRDLDGLDAFAKKRL